MEKRWSKQTVSFTQCTIIASFLTRRIVSNRVPRELPGHVLPWRLITSGAYRAHLYRTELENSFPFYAFYKSSHSHATFVRIAIANNSSGPRPKRDVVRSALTLGLCIFQSSTRKSSTPSSRGKPRNNAKTDSTSSGSSRIISCSAA